MSVATLRQVRCPGCGDSRDVSDRHARRLAATVDADCRCEECRRPRIVSYGNPEIVFWLEWAGVELPPWADGMAYIRIFGLPSRLNELCLELAGSVRYLP